MYFVKDFYHEALLVKSRDPKHLQSYDLNVGLLAYVTSIYVR